MGGNSLSLLILNEVEKSLSERKILKKVSLEINEGEVYGILGANGAGKSTLLRVIAGLTSIDEGKIEVAGYSLSKYPSEYKKMLGYVPDIPFLYGYLSGREYLNFLGDLWEIERERKRDLVEENLKLVGLLESADAMVTTYSHGMKQKLAIAGALITKPRVLILDEPMTGFDPPSAKFMKDFLKNYAKEGNAVIITTHILELAQHFCNRVGVLSDGNLNVEYNDLENLKKDFETLVVTSMEGIK